MSSYGNTILRNFDVWYVEENFRIDENVQVLEAKKKSAWTGLDRVDFEKISSKSQCPNRKIGVDRSRQR